MVVSGSGAYRPYAPAPAPHVGAGGWGTDAFGAARAVLPVRRDPLVLVLGALIVLAAGALVVAGFTARPAATAYANEDYAVPAPQTAPPPIPVPQGADEAERWRTANARSTARRTSSSTSAPGWPSGPGCRAGGRPTW